MANPGDWTIMYWVIIDWIIQLGPVKFRPLVLFIPKRGLDAKNALSLGIFVVRWMPSQEEMSLFRVSIFEGRIIVHALFLISLGISTKKPDGRSK